MQPISFASKNVMQILLNFKAPLHKFGMEGLDLPVRSLAGGYLIKSALN